MDKLTTVTEAAGGEFYGESCFDAGRALLSKEARGLSDIELVSILFGMSKKEALVWLQQTGGLRKLVESSSLGKALMEFSSRYLLEKIKIGDALEDPDTVRDFLATKIRDRQHEVFCVVFMDNRHRVIAFEEMFSGTINSSSVYPREVVKATLKHNAAAVIFAHNHPSGNPEPSQADERITQRLKEALALVDVRVIDHFVVGDQVLSFVERGLL